MIEEPEALIPLWDYGWCEHRIIECQGKSDIEIVKNYLECEEFGTSFVFPEPGDNPTLHGPFLRSAIQTSHFVPVSIEEVLPRLKSICFDSPGTKPVSQEQWDELEHLTESLVKRSDVAFQLTLTTENTEAQHEWGWVILDFHEFIFTTRGSGKIERLVIGYD
ncbi:MAG: hypothetical protein IPN59_06805 [Holophaga sp.]|nr:hypothetical protein [Holophaga sp.]